MNTEWIVSLPEFKRERVLRDIRALEAERNEALLRVAEQEKELRRLSEATLALGTTIRTKCEDFEYKATVSFSREAWCSQPRRFAEEMIRALSTRVVQCIIKEIEVSGPLNALVGKYVKIRSRSPGLRGQLEGPLTFDQASNQYYVGEKYFFQTYFTSGQVESITENVITLRPEG